MCLDLLLLFLIKKTRRNICISITCSLLLKCGNSVWDRGIKFLPVKLKKKNNQSSKLGDSLCVKPLKTFLFYIV